MAVRVRVDSGPIEPDDMLHTVPQDKWEELVNKRRRFIQTSIPYDCRCLVQFVKEAEEMWKELGYESADHLIAEGYGLAPEGIRLAVGWLELNEPEYAVSLDEVKDAATRNQQAAKVTTGEVLPRGGDVKSQEAKSIRNLRIDISQGSRAKEAGIGKRTQEKLDALAREAPDKLAEVKEGKISVHKACIEAGIITVPTILEKLWKLWQQAKEEERKDFLKRVKQEPTNEPTATN